MREKLLLSCFFQVPNVLTVDILCADLISYVCSHLCTFGTLNVWKVPLLSADLSVIFEGLQGISGPQRDNKVADTCSRALCKEASCFYSSLYGGNCQVTSPCTWKIHQVLWCWPPSAKEECPCKANGNLFKDITSSIAHLNSNIYAFILLVPRSENLWIPVKSTHLSKIKAVSKLFCS